jgi:hypothetical protein
MGMCALGAGKSSTRSRYRILTQLSSQREVRYLPQKRLLWRWWDMTVVADGGSTWHMTFETFEQAALG